MAPSEPDPFEPWFAALEARHLSQLTFAEVRRALQALSSLYVERRQRLATGAALEGAGKRAAFALFYSPLHFLLVREIVRALGAAAPAPSRILDLGCGTGASGAAWALECARTLAILAVDRHPWAIQETRWTLRALGLSGEARRTDLSVFRFRGRAEAVLAAFTLNELKDDARELLLTRMMEAGRAGAALLVVEPIARRSLNWWESWSSVFAAAGGRSDTWRFRKALPERLRLLDKAAGMDHRELTARSLWFRGSETSVR